MIKYCNWLAEPKITSLHINSGAHGGYNEVDDVYFELEPEFFERDKELLERLAPKINLPVTLHQITYEDGPRYDVESTLIINAFCFSFDYTPQESDKQPGSNRTGGGKVNSPQNTSVVPAQPSTDEKEDSQDEKDPVFWTYIKGNFDWIEFGGNKYSECDIDQGIFCYNGLGK